MRLVWIALSLLLAMLVAPPGGASKLTDHAGGRDDPASYVIQVTHLTDPAALLSPSLGRLEGFSGGEQTVRHPEAGDAHERLAANSPSAGARLRWRVISVASLDFAARLRHSVDGFLPSYSTVCPPPRAA